MLDLKIDRLSLNFSDATGHAHRVEPIVRQAIDLLAARIHVSEFAIAPNTQVDMIQPPPVNLDLDRMSDDQVADALATALLDALKLKLKIS